MAIVCAVPYLRDRDLRRAEAGDTAEQRHQKVTMGITEHYNAVLQAALAKCDDAQKLPMIATSHLLTTGGQRIDGDGVRDLYVGTLAHLSAAAFPQRFDFVALGHLHIPQVVGQTSRLRYCGAPIPMGFGEATKPKEVVLVEWQGLSSTVTSIPIPVFQKLQRIEGDMDAIEQAIIPLLENDYTGHQILPELKERIGQLTENSAVEVLRIRNRQVFNQVMQRIEALEELSDLDAKEVFRRRLDAQNVPDEQRAELFECHEEIRRTILETDTQAE